MRGFLRSDGRKGIRNIVAVAYLVECAHHVAREIVASDRQQAHLIGFPGCFPNDYAQKMMEKLCTHPNVGAVLLVKRFMVIGLLFLGVTGTCEMRRRSNTFLLPGCCW